MEQEIEALAIEHAASLKRYLIKNFPEKVAFFPSGKYLIVHPNDINSCKYSIATLCGCGLRDSDFEKIFDKITLQKL